MVHQTDVTSEDSVLSLFEVTEQAHGRVDILINNSGVFDNGPFHELSLATWQKVVDVNLTGPFLCARSAFRSMLKTGGGRIVNVASISAQMCRPNASPYNSTKHALTGLTKSIALEGRDHDIVCSVLHPGNILTERRAASDTATDQEPMMTVGRTGGDGPGHGDAAAPCQCPGDHCPAHHPGLSGPRLIPPKTHAPPTPGKFEGKTLSLTPARSRVPDAARPRDRGPDQTKVQDAAVRIGL